MAEKKKGKTENTAEETTKQPSHLDEARDRLFRLIQILLPTIGLFAALCYFLGRLRTEAYYHALGITPHVLQFTAEDYMFSSFNLILMCLNISVWFYMYWRWARLEKRLVLGFPIAKGPRREQVTDILLVITLFITWLFLIWNIFSSKGVALAVPGFMGLNAGFVIGIGLIIYAWFMQTSTGGKKLGFLGILIIGMVLFASIPSITTRLAEIEARKDITKFPQAVLMCEDRLPNELQSLSSIPTKSTEVRLIITNNGMTYVLKQDNGSTNEWQIYAIPEDSIKLIIYLHEK